MLGFDGSSTSKQKPVNLGGRSLKQSGAVVETKQQLAERNAKVRTQREQERANNSAASCISLAWRVGRARCAAKSRIQEVAEHALNHFSPSTGGSVAACASHDGEPLPLPVADSSARAFRCCCSAYMFLRRSSLLDSASALYQRLLHVLHSSLDRVFSYDAQSGVRMDVLEEMLPRVGNLDLRRVLRAVGSDLLSSVFRVNSFRTAASALKLLSVPLWSCLKCDAVACSRDVSAVEHHAATAVILCRCCALAAPSHTREASVGDGCYEASVRRGALLQILVSACVASTHAAHTAAVSSPPQLSSGSTPLNPMPSVARAWRDHLLRLPGLIDLCPHVFSLQHPHTAPIWSQLLHSVLSSGAPVDNTALINMACACAVLRDLKSIGALSAPFPCTSHHFITRDIVAVFLREVCPSPAGDLPANTARIASWLNGLSRTQLEAHLRSTRLLCDVAAPILRTAPSSIVMSFIKLCAFEYPMPALLLAQNVRAPLERSARTWRRFNFSIAASNVLVSGSDADSQHSNRA